MAVNEQRRKRRREYRRLHDDLVSILYRHDPTGIGITMGGPPGEYEPEAGSILPRLKGVSTAQEMAPILREEFSRWFSEDLAGPAETYLPIAAEILAVTRRQTDAGIGRADAAGSGK